MVALLLTLPYTTIFSFSESAQPLTPTRTPTSATFLQTSFETPKQESSFYDPRVTWNTADPYATTPDFLKTPKFPTFTTPNQSPLLGLSRKRRLSGQNIEDQIAAHVHHISPNPNPPTPSLEAPHPPSSSPKYSSTSLLKRNSVASTLDQTDPQLSTGAGQPVDSATRSADSMQTPPPTSTSVSRRKGEQVQTPKVSSGSAASLRRMSTPTGPKPRKGEGLSAQVEESPLQLGTLQFSPDGLGFSMSGSATVPAYPQHKLFWDSNHNGDGMSMDFPYEPFALGLENSKNLDSFKSSHQRANVSHLPSSSLDELGIRDSREMDLERSTNHDPVNPADFISSGLVTQNVPKGVNPSLLFSSPRQAEQQSVPVQGIPNEALQPYASQLRDAQIDHESGLERVPKRRRKIFDDSPAVKAALQSLREETESRTSEDFSDDVIPVPSRVANVKASRATSRASESSRRPGSTRNLQRGTHHQASVQPLKSRTAVTLTIDENGRAKTETKIIHEGAGLSEQLPNSNSKVTNDSEEGESTSSSESDEMVISQPQSFAFPTQKAGKPRMARFMTDSKTHSQKSSYTSTLASSNAGYSLAASDKSDLRTGSARGPRSSSRRESPATRRLHRVRPSTGVSNDVNQVRGGRDIEINSEAESITTSDDDQGDAQSELKKIVRVRAQSRSSIQGRARKTSNVSPSSRAQMPPDLFGALAFSHEDGTNTLNNISPTTITDPGLSTPGTGRDSLLGEATRCVCPGYEIEGELMILWYVKHTYLHETHVNDQVVIHASIGYMWDASVSIVIDFLGSICVYFVWGKHQVPQAGVRASPQRQLSQCLVHL